jgi:lysophospholipase L1-like esterase
LFADNILTFGDSLTYGITSFCGLGSEQCGSRTTPYAQRLQGWLRARFPAQAASIQAHESGSPGECASAPCTAATVAGRNRLPGVIASVHDLVVILEGVNDTNAISSDTFIIDALRVMVQTAKSAGKSVILSGLLPVKENEDIPGTFKAAPGRIASMNASLAALAAAEDVPFVDMVAAFGSGYRSLLSPDGLHPNDAGYQRMAEAIGNTVVAFFAIP